MRQSTHDIISTSYYGGDNDDDRKSSSNSRYSLFVCSRCPSVALSPLILLSACNDAHMNTVSALVCQLRNLSADWLNRCQSRIGPRSRITCWLRPFVTPPYFLTSTFLLHDCSYNIGTCHLNVYFSLTTRKRLLHFDCIHEILVLWRHSSHEKRQQTEDKRTAQNEYS